MGERGGGRRGEGRGSPKRRPPVLEAGGHLCFVLITSKRRFHRYGLDVHLDYLCPVQSQTAVNHPSKARFFSLGTTALGGRGGAGIGPWVGAHVPAGDAEAGLVGKANPLGAQPHPGLGGAESWMLEAHR